MTRAEWIKRLEDTSYDEDGTPSWGRYLDDDDCRRLAMFLRDKGPVIDEITEAVDRMLEFTEAGNSVKRRILVYLHEMPRE